MADDKNHRLMPEKTVEWLQAEALRCCRHRHGCSHLQAVIIGRTRPTNGGPNWELLAFKPELALSAEYDAMEEIHRLRGTYDLKRK